MKRWSWFLAILAVLFACGVSPAAAVGRATADFDNLRPDRGETEFGRLAADAARAAAHADIALIYSGSLRRGTLKAGPVGANEVNALLAFGDDDVVTISINGAQLRAALERAAQAYPTGSPAFLHCSGFIAQFNAQAPINRRVSMVRFNGREVENQDTFTCAMPVSLAQGAAGYFTIWKGDAFHRVGAGVTLASSIVAYVQERGDIAPDDTPRFAAV
jgi:2',3'-cyclic-nucleotide 2'-phosphodiesterase (5'-nucleotidase family)